MRIRIVVAAIVIVALTVLVLPGGVGVVAERQQQQILTRLGERLNANVVSEGYRRGWFRSEARYRLTPRKRDDGAATDTGRGSSLVITSSIRHGPFAPGLHQAAFRPGIAGVRSSLALASADGTRSLPGVVYTRVGLGGGRAHYVSGRVEETLPTGSVLHWDGGEATVAFDDDAERFRVTGELGKLRIERRDLELAVGPVGLDGELSRSPHGFWNGSIAVQIAELVPQGTESNDLRLSDVEIAATFDDGSGASRPRSTRNRVSLALRASAASLQSGDWDGGEAIIDFRVEGLEREAFKASLVEWQERAVSIQADSWKLDAPAAVAQLRPLFEKGGTVALDKLRIPTRHGNLEANVRVALEAQTAPLGPAGLWEYSNADISVHFPQALTDQPAGASPASGGMLGNLVNYGLLRPAGDSYAIEGSYADGILTVNGASLPFPPPAQPPAGASAGDDHAIGLQVR